MYWLVADSLSCREQMFCSHLESYSHYLHQAGEFVIPVQVNSPTFIDVAGFLAYDNQAFDVLFMLDRYELALRYQHAKVRIAQVAAICNPMPWDVRKPDGSPAYDLVISSIPWMVDQARAKGCRAEYMPLAFDTRARVCGMGVERDLDCIFIGTVGPNHQRRSQLLAELRDVVTVMPPVFGREYFKTLARAKVVVNPHAEWSRGCANNMRIFEAGGMGAVCISDGRSPDIAPWQRVPSYPSGGPRTTSEWRDNMKYGLRYHSDFHAQGYVFQHHTYENRIPTLVKWAKELLR